VTGKIILKPRVVDLCEIARQSVRMMESAAAEQQVELSADLPDGLALEHESAASLVDRLRETERARRRSFAGPLERAASAYLVRRGDGRTLIAGYPWFGDWGRDTFIALRGLCLATGRLDVARDILIAWSATPGRGPRE